VVGATFDKDVPVAYRAGPALTFVLDPEHKVVAKIVRRGAAVRRALRERG
jgi:hypothetical protein